MQYVICLATDACLTADPGVASSIPARSNTFLEIDHEIIFMIWMIGRVNPGKYGQGGKYGHMTYNSHVQEHRSVTKECFISALNSIYSALLHPYTTYI